MYKKILLLMSIFILTTQTINAQEPVISIPYVEELPNYEYDNLIPLTWEGGEIKFGKWRQFFNAFEMGFGITYNSKYNINNNTWEPRDSADSRACICSMLRFNVSEGNVGGNAFEINFAKGDSSNSIPDWNSAAHYFFYDGNSKTKAPAALQITGAGNMDALIQLAPDEGAYTSRVNLRNSIDGNFYIEYDPYGKNPYDYRDNNYNTIPLLTINKYNGNIGIGTGNNKPSSELDIIGTLTLQHKEILPDPPNPPLSNTQTKTKMSLSIDANGDIIIQVEHNNEIRQGIIINFKDLPLAK